MEPTPEMLYNLDRANRLRSWADLFGFQIEMGREGDIPFVMVDGVRYEADEAQEALFLAASAMGMSEETLNGE